MSLMGPITDAERRGWQLRGARALVDILQVAKKASLPPIGWQVGSTAMLVGRIVDGDRRAQFEAWADVLGLDERWPENPDRNGRVHLNARRKGWGDDPLVTVCVIADIESEFEEES